MPAQSTAQMHRKLAEPSSAKHDHPEREEVHPICAGRHQPSKEGKR
jgi:hypothetical protein